MRLRPHSRHYRDSRARQSKAGLTKSSLIWARSAACLSTYLGISSRSKSGPDSGGGFSRKRMSQKNPDLEWREIGDVRSEVDLELCSSTASPSLHFVKRE